MGKAETFRATGWVPSTDTWDNPGFNQGPDYPVVEVSWDDANAFCQWLTNKERTEGRITSDQRYRLPTDAEWSNAAGLTEDAQGTPESKSIPKTDGSGPSGHETSPRTIRLNNGQTALEAFSWGIKWPPPSGSANLADESFRKVFSNINGPLKGYNDGFANTSPVGIFQPNQYGLYDMSGNVSQWCEDWEDSSQHLRTLRGSSWEDGGELDVLLQNRGEDEPGGRASCNGFRCVLMSADGVKGTGLGIYERPGAKWVDVAWYDGSDEEIQKVVKALSSQGIKSEPTSASSFSDPMPVLKIARSDESKSRQIIAQMIKQDRVRGVELLR
jgi:formylglycine-generating enzyme required for sulfatase activity